MKKFIEKGFHIRFEKADNLNSTKWFDLAKGKGWLPSMVAHRNLTYPTFTWTNFDKWYESNPLPESKPILPYPPKIDKSKYKTACDTIEEEEEETKRYVKENPTSFEGFEEFIKNFTEGENQIVDTFKKRGDLRGVCYGWFQQLLEVVENKEKSKEIAEEITNKFGNNTGFKLLQLTHYILAWYFKVDTYIIPASYPRQLEYYWDGVGDWVC